MRIDLSAYATPMIVIIYVAFAPIGLDLLYNPLIAGDYSSPWPVIYGLARYFACLAFAGSVLLSQGRGDYLKALTPLAPFLLFAAVSIVWSYDPKSTYKQLFYLVCLAVWISAIVKWITIPELLRTSSIINSLIIFASLFLAVFVPHIGRHHGTDLVEPSHAGNWRGMFIHKNILGEFSVTTFLLLLRDIRKESAPMQLFFWAARIATLICLVFCKSSNALLGFGCAVVAYGLLINRPTAKPIFLALIATLAAVLIFGLSLTPAKFAALLGRDPHFTGRTEIWAFGHKLINDHIWIGHGYSSADNIFGELATKVVFGSATSLHNGYLDIMFDGGVVELILLLGAVVFVVSRAYFATFSMQGVERQGVVTYIAIIISACAMASGETSPFRVVGDGVIGFWISMIALCHVASAQERSERRALSPTRSGRMVFTAPMGREIRRGRPGPQVSGPDYSS